jgi:hypothetical protein
MDIYGLLVDLSHEWYLLGLVIGVVLVYTDGIDLELVLPIPLLDLL